MGAWSMRPTSFRRYKPFLIPYKLKYLVIDKSFDDNWRLDV